MKLNFILYTTYFTYCHMQADNGGSRHSLLCILSSLLIGKNRFGLQLKSDLQIHLLISGFHYPEIAVIFNRILLSLSSFFHTICLSIILHPFFLVKETFLIFTPLLWHLTAPASAHTEVYSSPHRLPAD